MSWCSVIRTCLRVTWISISIFWEVQKLLTKLVSLKPMYLAFLKARQQLPLYKVFKCKRTLISILQQGEEILVVIFWEMKLKFCYLQKLAFSKSCMRRGKVSWGCQSSYQSDYNAVLFAKLKFFSGSFDKSRWNFIAQRNGKGAAYSTK